MFDAYWRGPLTGPHVQGAEYYDRRSIKSDFGDIIAQQSYETRVYLDRIDILRWKEARKTAYQRLEPSERRIVDAIWELAGGELAEKVAASVTKLRGGSSVG